MSKVCLGIVYTVTAWLWRCFSEYVAWIIEPKAACCRVFLEIRLIGSDNFGLENKTSWKSWCSHSQTYDTLSYMQLTYLTYDMLLKYVRFGRHFSSTAKNMAATSLFANVKFWQDFLLTIGKECKLMTQYPNLL